MTKDQFVNLTIAIILSGVPVPTLMNVYNASYWIQVILSVLTGMALKAWIKYDNNEPITRKVLIVEATASVLVCFIAWITYYHLGLTYNLMIYMIVVSFVSPHLIRFGNNFAKNDLWEIILDKIGFVKKQQNDPE